LQHVNTSRGGIAFDEKENAASNSGKIEFTQEIEPSHNFFLNPTHHFQSINVPPPSASSIASGERDNQSHLTSTHLTKQNNASHSLPISPSSLSAASFTTNSKLSSFKSITNKKNNTNTEKTLEQTSSSSSLSTSPQAQTTSQHLSPSPLAICDGLTITYGNSNLTQTFKPSTITCSSSKSFKESMSSLNEEKPVETASSTISLSPSPTTHSCPK
jgi:hypothetical protein